MKQPHIWTPEHDPQRIWEEACEADERQLKGVLTVPMGSASWWRRILPRKPEWWVRVFEESF